MFRINNEKELLGLLKIISEEAVGVSKRSLKESSDPYVSKYADSFQKDKQRYGSLSEQEDDEAEEIDAEDTPDQEPAEEPAEEPVEEPVEEPASADKETSQAFGASFDSVLTAINALRAGRSLKDDAIKQATSSYYDSLSQEEREVLLLFLKSLSTILSGGEDTMDPSDDPYNYVISKEGEETDEEAEAEETPEEEELEGEVADEMPEEEELEDEEELGTEEDTSPPIKVNEAQDFTGVRKKIRRIMLKG